MDYSEWKGKTDGFKKVDVRGVAGNFLEGIKKQAAGLPEGEGLEIIQTFEPIPLYEAMRELLKAYKNGIDSRALDDVFEQFAWNMGIGFFSSEIAPSPLFQAYKTIKQMERQGKSREEINTVLKEKFADKKPNPSA